MHVALLADGGWLDAEPAAFKALEVGLLDEQITVTQVVPISVGDSVGSTFSGRVTWLDSRWGPVRDFRIRRLAGALRRMKVTLVHALDGRLWPAAARLSRELHCPLVLGTTAAEDAARAGKAMAGLPQRRVAFTATTQAIAEALRASAGAEVLIERIPPGVHVPEEPVPRRADREAPCLIVTGTGRWDAGYEALFGALRGYAQSRPLAQFFLEARGSDQHGLWQAAKKLDLLTHINLVPPQSGRHQVLLQADALLQPQAARRSRTFTLHAMAQGVPVIALADPILDYLIDRQTAWVVDAPEQHRWSAKLEQLDSDRAGIESLIASARQWCSKRHLLSHRVVQVIKVYRALSEA